MAAARFRGGSALMKGLRRLEPVLVRDTRSGLSVSVSIATGELPSVGVGISSAPSMDRQMRFYSSGEGSDDLLRSAVKHGIKAGLSNALKNLKPDVGPSIRRSVLQEAVDAGVKAALKDANLSVEPHWPVLNEDQKATKLAVKLGIFEALKEMQERRGGKEPLQEFVEDPKLAVAMDKFNDTMQDFILVYKNMFTAEDGEEGTVSGKSDNSRKDGVSGVQSAGESEGYKFYGSEKTKDGGEEFPGGETKGGEYGAKTRRGLNKFDLFLKKYNEDNLETVKVLKELLQNTEAVKQHQMKSKDFVADWFNETADAYLGKVRMDNFRKVMTSEEKSEEKNDDVPKPE